MLGWLANVRWHWIHNKMTSLYLLLIGELVLSQVKGYHVVDIQTVYVFTESEK